MIFRENTFSVLIVSSSAQFTEKLTAMLPPSDYYPITSVATAAEARRTLLERDFDIVLINTPLTDEHGTRLSAQIASDHNAGVMLFVRNEQYDEIYAKVLEYGVMVMGKPIASAFITQALRMLCASRERIKTMEKRQSSVEDRIREIRLINRAKCLLIEHESMTEADAHRYLEKHAMDLRVEKTALADSIIRRYS